MRPGLAHGCLVWGGCNKPAHPWTQDIGPCKMLKEFLRRYWVFCL